MKKIYMLFLFLIFIYSTSYIYAKQKESEFLLFGKVIYIDPGHGGLDPGTVYKNIYEKDINLSICKKLKEMFPYIELLPLDYDPDVSRANIENRLQMLIMNQKTEESIADSEP